MGFNSGFKGLIMLEDAHMVTYYIFPVKGECASFAE